MRRAIKRQLWPALLNAPCETPTIDEPAVAEPDVDQAVEESPAYQSAGPGSGGDQFRVILYNDDYHGQDEVAEQLQKATEYSMLKCWAIMMEAHAKGRAICYHGTREKCHHVAKVLREIRLQCEVDCD